MQLEISRAEIWARYGACVFIKKRDKTLGKKLTVF